MDLRNLNTFIHVAELNSFTRAAEKLGYSQPTVSFQIKQLEAELDAQLFERIGHTVSLTDAGRAALGYAQDICRMSQEMLAGEDKHNEAQGEIHIAMADSLCSPIIKDGFAEFREEYPNVSLKVTTAGTGELFRLLDHNEVDLVCTLDEHIYNTSYIIAAEEKVGVSFVISSDDPLADMAEVSVEELITHPFILTEKGMSYRRLLDNQLARRDIELQPILELGGADLLCQLAVQGVGISFLPNYVTDRAVREGSLVRLNVPDIRIELWKQILYHRGKWMSAQLKAVIEHLCKL